MSEGHRTCYADTHLKGPGYWSVCGQVSNIVAVEDPTLVTCEHCTAGAALSTGEDPT